MAKNLSKALGTMNLSDLAQMIQAQGRGRDTVLAHITPKEAALLKARGGRGSINPVTGLPEFEEEYYGPEMDYTATSEAPPMPVPQEYQSYSPIAEQESQDYFSTTPQQTYTPPVAETPIQPVPTLPQERVSGYDVEGGGYYPGGGEVPTAEEGKITSTMEEEQKRQQQRVVGRPPAVAGEKGFDWGKLAYGLGLGALGGMNIAQTRRAQQQAQQSQAQLQALATPYQQQGAQLMSQAQTGALTPQNQRILEAARAQAQQRIARTGGVGVQQAANTVADLQARLLENQYNLGLRVSQIGDAYAQGAIRTGMEADRAINQANAQFYAQLAQLAAPLFLGQRPIYQTGV